MSAQPATMQAVVVDRPRPIDAVRHSRVPVPHPSQGQVLVKVHATTVISSELASVAGVSMADLPLILGNDFVGTVVHSAADGIPDGTRVIGAYGGYGYTRDGAWAEYICVDAADAWPITSRLDSVQLAAIPGSFTAATGALHALGPVDGRTLLVRGGTSGVGLAVATLALAAGATVISTTRDRDKRDRLLDHGIHHVLIDGPDLDRQLRMVAPAGAHLAVELLGVSTLPSTLQLVRDYGIVCLTGLLADQTQSRQSGIREDRSLHVFPHPMEMIPPTVRLTAGGVHGSPRTAAMVQQWVDGVASGLYRMPIDSVFGLDDLASAYDRRADPRAFGKIVISVAPDHPRMPARTLSHQSAPLPHDQRMTTR
jgi:NADPH2:quinone reductase